MLLLLAVLLLGAASALSSNQIVDSAPAATLENDVDDVNAYGACAKYTAASSCKKVARGEGRLAECISGAVEAKEAGTAESSEVPVPEDCQEEVYQYYINRNPNINKNIPLARACKADVAKMCNGSALALFGEQEVNIIVCLKESKDAVSPPCQREVYKLIKEVRGAGAEGGTEERGMGGGQAAGGGGTCIVRAFGCPCWPRSAHAGSSPGGRCSGGRWLLRCWCCRRLPAACHPLRARPFLHPPPTAHKRSAQRLLAC
jgi:hypothetical protein